MGGSRRSPLTGATPCLRRLQEGVSLGSWCAPGRDSGGGERGQGEGAREGSGLFLGLEKVHLDKNPSLPPRPLFFFHSTLEAALFFLASRVPAQIMETGLPVLPHPHLGPHGKNKNSKTSVPDGVQRRASGSTDADCAHALGTPEPNCSSPGCPLAWGLEAVRLWLSQAQVRLACLTPRLALRLGSGRLPGSSEQRSSRSGMEKQGAAWVEIRVPRVERD